MGEVEVVAVVGIVMLGMACFLLVIAITGGLNLFESLVLIALAILLLK